MKKTKVVIGIGIFTILTFFFCTGGDSYYKKDVNFKSVEEIVEQLDKHPIHIVKEDGRYYSTIPTNEFLECLSKRKRYTVPNFDINDLNIIRERELDEAGVEIILQDYIDRCKNLTDYKPYENAIVKSYIVEFNVGYGDTQMQSGVLNMVFIDEGEGYVIDYLTISTEGGEKNVTGF